MANKNILQLNNIEDNLSLGDYFIVWDKEENISEPTKKVTLAELINIFSGITSVNGKTDSEVILKTDDISSAGQNNKYVTQTEKDKLSKIKTDQPSDTFLNGQGVYTNIPVIDNLLTENQYLGLSANQGKILKDLNDSLSLLINNITNGVPEAGDSLLKLFNLISSNSSLIQDIYLILQSDTETLDTFQEIVDFIESNRDDLDNYVLALQNKVDKEEGKSLVSDLEKTGWNDKYTKQEIDDKLIEKSNNNELAVQKGEGKNSVKTYQTKYVGQVTLTNNSANVEGIDTQFLTDFDETDNFWVVDDSGDIHNLFILSIIDDINLALEDEYIGVSGNYNFYHNINIATGDNSVALGGNGNTVTDSCSASVAGQGNKIFAGSTHSVLAGGKNNIIYNSPFSGIGGGEDITIPAGKSHRWFSQILSTGGGKVGAAIIEFWNSASEGVLSWNPTANRVIELPDKDGTIALLDDLGSSVVTEAEKTRWDDKYTKDEVDNKFTDFGTNLIWKAAVETFSDLATTYPDPLDNWTVPVNDELVDYRYDAETTQWINIGNSAIPKATAEVDGKLSKEDYVKLQNIATEATKNTNTDELAEGSNNKYFTEARAIVSKLVGYTKATTVTAISAATSILEAIGILEKSLDNKVDKEEGKVLVSEQEKTDWSDKYTKDEVDSLLTIKTYADNITGNILLDLSDKDVVKLTLTGNVTSFDVENHVVGKTYKIYMIQDSIGNRTLTGLDSKFKTENDIPILLSTDQNAVDLLQLDVFSETDIKIYPVYNI